MGGPLAELSGSVPRAARNGSGRPGTEPPLSVWEGALGNPAPAKGPAPLQDGGVLQGSPCAIVRPPSQTAILIPPLQSLRSAGASVGARG
jgi:hypothetical protein